MGRTARTLLLMRHAKAACPTGVVDRDRPLASRGIREAGLAGAWLRSHAPSIDHVLCSTARRTRDTLARIGVDTTVSYVDRLYAATPGAVIEEINSVDASVSTILIIGHEPTISQVTLGLATAQSSNTAVAEAVSTKFPTSAIAMLTTSQPWRQLQLGSAALVGFHIPR